MSPELDKILCEKYPLIFKNRWGDVRETAMCWGFEHGDGWFDILDVLCGLLYAPYRRAIQDYDRARKLEGTSPYKGAPVVSAVEVERKRLAMREAELSVPVAVQVKEKFGTLQVYLDGAHDELAQGYLSFAAAMSARTCEECGAPGKLRNGGWLRTLCDHHDQERRNQR